MRQRIGVALIAAGITALLPAGSVTPASAAPSPRGPSSTTVLIDPHAVYTVPQVPKPAYLAPSTDPTFGSTVERVGNNVGASTAPLSGTWGSDARHVYSKQQPWNSDNTLLIIENRGGGSPASMILDGTTYLPKLAPCANYDLYDYRWHPSPSHPHEQINVNSAGKELMWYDVTTCTKTRSWTLPITSNYGIGSGEGNPSNDGRFVALASDSQMVIVDMDPGPPFASYPNKRIGPPRRISDCGLSDCSIDWVSASASGKYAVVSYNGDYPRVFDIDPQTLALTPHAYPKSTPECLSHDPAKGFILDLGHADFALNPFDANEDVMIGQRSSGCPSTVNGVPMAGVVMVRLRDGFVTMLTNPTNEAFPRHVSARNLDRPGWAYVSYYPSPGQRFSDEIIAVKLDGSQSVERLCHIHSADDGCYRCEAHPVPSRDGARVLFASNWAQDCGAGCGSSADIKDYIVTDAAAGGTPVLLSLVSAEEKDGRVQLEWYSPDAVALSASVYRRTGSSDWRSLGSVVGDGSGHLRYEDRTDSAGVRYAYRLGYVERGLERFTAETWVDVRVALALVLEGARPNPSSGALAASFTLPVAQPATLELFDVSGRSLVSREVGSLGVGAHVVDLTSGKPLVAGIYLLRLRQAGKSYNATCVVLR